MMYELIAPVHLGRDKFERFCFSNGFKLAVRRSFHRTTNSSGVIHFPNLVEGKKVTGINQVWVSDITYYRIGEKFYYLTFILDLYSRFLVGYSVSKNLSLEQTTLPALEMAINTGRPVKGLIFHSDGGGQYYGNIWKNLTGRLKIKNSMCDNVYENAHAERLNGTIKNDYLEPMGAEEYDKLVADTKNTSWLYNYERPHQSLGKMSPHQFETALRAKVKKEKVKQKRAEVDYVDN
jgi:transposase InsO family protein